MTVLTLDLDRLPPLVADTIPIEIVRGNEGNTGSAPLFGVVDVALKGKRLVVAEGSSQSIRVFDGALPGISLGRSGDGPAEFRGLSRIYPIGDSAVGAFDQRRRRYVELDWSGVLLREVAVPQQVLGEVQVLERDGAGALYVASLASLPARQALHHRGEGPVVRLLTQDTIAMIRGNSAFRTAEAAGAVLFGATTLIAVSDNGLWIADTSERQVTLIAPDGRTRARVRWVSSAPRRVTDRIIGEFWEQLAEAAPPGQEEALQFAQQRAVYADSVPAASSLLVSTVGELWIGDYVGQHVALMDAPYPAQEWLVVNVEQRSAVRVTTPRGLRVYEVGSDYILGVYKNDLHVETVRVYTRPDQEQ